MSECSDRPGPKLASGLLGVLMLLLWLVPSALAGPPTHLRNAALDVGGFDHACGAAVDSKGDLYLASAGESKVRVFNPAHTELTSISNANEPCGLAVDSKGNLYVSEQATGKVVRYKPNAYPFAGPPTYGAAEPIDSSGTARGISIDRRDDRLYVAEGNRISLYDADGSFAAVNEVQEVRVVEASGGTFKLSFEGSETGPIAHNASAAEVETALQALATIGAGNIEVQKPASEYLVTFKGALSDTDVEALKADASGLEGTAGKAVLISEKTKGFSGHIGEGELTDARGVAVYSHVVNAGAADTYLFAADAATDQVKVFSGAVGIPFTPAKLRRTIKGPKAGEDFGFGPAGAYLAVDPGNRNLENDKCASVAEQACTAGHLLVYDEAHKAVDEFDATGEFLDRFTDPAFADAEPTALAIDRSGGSGDGTIYVSAGAGPGAKLLAFGPLAAPSRAPAPQLSHVLPKAQAVATDSHGNVYVAAGPLIHVYDPTGKELAVGAEGKGIEDTHTGLDDLALDSDCNVYVLESEASNQAVTHYTPSACPPAGGTTYSRQVVTTPDDFPSENKSLDAITVNPLDDHLFVTAGFVTHELDSATTGHESKLLDPCFACEPINLGVRQSIGAYGANGNIYFGANGRPIAVVSAAGEEVLARINGAGAPSGQFAKANQFVAVDQSNGHVLEYDAGAGAREYDAAGAFVAEFGKFSDGGATPYRVAIDSACALHDPPLTEETIPTCKEFDPANGTVYVAFDDPAPKTFDLTAFAPLAYGEAPLAVSGGAGGLGAGEATLNGTVNPNGFDLTECKFEYLSDAQYLANGKTFAGAGSKPCAESSAAIGHGSAPVAVHAALSGLDPAGRYRFRLFAKNKYGESRGAVGLFGPPVITTKAALPVLYEEATLRAEIDPSGLATKYHFEYGTSEAYGQSTPVAELAPGDGPLAVEAPLTGLAPGTLYHFRIVAENEAGALQEPDQTFETLARPKPQECPNTEFRTGLSAKLPDCRAYELITPAETGGASPYAAGPGDPGAGFNDWLAAPRGAGAGERVSYFVDGTLPGFEGNGLFDGYRAQRGPGAHPPQGWGNELIGPTYLQAVPGFTHPPSQRGIAADQLYSFWQIRPGEVLEGTLAEGAYVRTPAGFEVVGQGSLGADLNATGKFLSAGGAHVIFTSKAHLEGEEGNEAAPQGTAAIYDRAVGSGEAKVISLKPNGEPFGAGEDATYVAASEDGAAVLFRVAGTLYLHRGSQTSAVAAAPNAFAGVSEDGERVFFAKAASGEAPADLFLCDTGAGSCAGPEAAQEASEIVAGAIFANVSPDGSHVFFSSKEAIPGVQPNDNGETAQAGEHNLYAWEGETEALAFIAVLDPRDFLSFGGVPQMDLGAWTTAINPGPAMGRPDSPTRATPAGDVFLFQSHARLSAYDNEGHGEIYRYQPAAAAGERLLCVSCDPSGAPASADAMLEELSGSPLHSTTMIANLTDDGQAVFFTSADPLVPEDANSVLDVYEWRAKGAGDCERQGGCLALISSGQGESDSFLYGMSADGHDVFFRTLEKLVGADVLGSKSIYDARVEGGIPDPPAKAPCQGDACQGNGQVPPVLASPASSTLKEGGNSGGEEGKTRCAKGQRKVRRAGKTRCVKRHHRPKRRANHDRRAHR